MFFSSLFHALRIICGYPLEFDAIPTEAIYAESSQASEIIRPTSNVRLEVFGGIRL